MLFDVQYVYSMETSNQQSEGLLVLGETKVNNKSSGFNVIIKLDGPCYHGDANVKQRVRSFPQGGFPSFKNWLAVLTNELVNLGYCSGFGSVSGFLETGDGYYDKYSFRDISELEVMLKLGATTERRKMYDNTGDNTWRVKS